LQFLAQTKTLVLTIREAIRINAAAMNLDTGTEREWRFMRSADVPANPGRSIYSNLALAIPAVRA
jgi:hypothetical protein